MVKKGHNKFGNSGLYTEDTIQDDEPDKIIPRKGNNSKLYEDDVIQQNDEPDQTMYDESVFQGEGASEDTIITEPPIRSEINPNQHRNDDMSTDATHLSSTGNTSYDR